MRIRKQEQGFSHIEVALLAVIVGAIGFVGWYVYHAKQTANKVLSSTSTPAVTAGKIASTNSTASTASGKKAVIDTTALQTNLNAVTSSSSQNTTDINNSNNAVNDQSGFTTVPQ